VKKLCRAPDIQINKSRPETKKLNENHTLIVNRKRILLERCAHRWRGMWMLPTHPTFDRLKQSKPRRAIYVSVFPFTHHRITLQVFRAQLGKIDKQTQRWFSRGELDSIPIPSPHRRAIAQLLIEG
jgi:adenine-specific DNA glycosylase